MKTERTVHESMNASADVAPPAAAQLISEEELRRMPESAYMNEVQLAFFHAMLTKMAEELLATETNHGEEMREHEYAADPVDRASQEETHSLGLLNRVRQTRHYTDVRQALARIESGDFGYCTVSGDPIGIPRLLARPTATMTVDQQDRMEKRSRTFAVAQ